MKRKAESVDESKVYFVGVGESSSPDDRAAGPDGRRMRILSVVNRLVRECLMDEERQRLATGLWQARLGQPDPSQRRRRPGSGGRDRSR